MDTKTQLVTYRNEIVTASQHLTVMQQRIIFSAIAQVPANKEISDRDVFEVTLAQVNSLGGDSNNTYKQLQDASRSLIRKVVTLSSKTSDGRSKLKEFPWAQYTEYVEGEGIIKIRFSYGIIPFISQIRECFTFYELQEMTGFSSQYSQPLYVRLMLRMRDHAKGKHRILPRWSEEIEVETLKKMFGTEKKIWSSFRRDVLDVTQKQINNSPYTKFSFEWEPSRKEGKKIIALRFKMKLKEDEPAKRALTQTKEKSSFSIPEEHVPMVADWLSGKNPGKYRKAGSSWLKFREFLIAQGRIETTEGETPEELRTILLPKLKSPAFVELIRPWLALVGYQDAL